jgi:hypothetical protein
MRPCSGTLQLWVRATRLSCTAASAEAIRHESARFASGASNASEHGVRSPFLSFFSSAVLLALHGAACDSGVPTAVTPAPLQSPGIANVQPQDDDVVARRAADARCERADECHLIGARRYGWRSRQACINEMRARAGAEIPPSGCAHGVDPVAIDYCVGEILAEGCGDPRRDFGHMPACRLSSMCRR